MRPDLTTPARAGWAALGGAALVAVIAVLVASGDDLGGQLDKASKDYAQKQGGAQFAHILSEQRKANDELSRTIGQLKRDTGMSRNPYFIVPPGTQQKGYLWRERFIWVQDLLRKRARDRSVQINDDLGFGQYAEGVAPEDLAEDLLTALQLVQKSATIALSTKDSNFLSITVKPELKPILAGAKDRPLLREFPITITVVGSDRDILWVLHRFSLVEAETLAAQQNADPAGEAAEDAAIAKLFPKLSKPSGMHELTPEDTQALDAYVTKRDYPLIVQRLKIDGENATERDQIQQLSATFVVAGMRFLTEDERARAGGGTAPTPGRGRGPAASAPSPSASATTAPASAAPATGRVPAAAFQARP